MNTVHLARCQFPRRKASAVLRWGWRAGVLAFLLGLSSGNAAEPSPAAPPEWQRDLNAARVLQTALAMAPAADPSEDAERRQRLSQLYRQLAARYPDQPTVQKAAGDFYDQTGQPDQALACWQHAEALAPRDAALAGNIGAALLQRGRVREACCEFERAVAARPDVAAYHFELANVLYLFRHEVLSPPDRPDEQAALTEALEHFRRATELAPGDLRLAQAYAETFYIFPKPDWDRALLAWKAVLALSGAKTDFANGHLARVSLRLGRRDDMETYLDRIQSPSFDTMKVKFRRQAASPAVSAPSPDIPPQ